MEKYKFKNDDAPIEMILCPFCGRRLNRVNLLLPTYCKECKHEFTPKVLTVKEVEVIN